MRTIGAPPHPRAGGTNYGWGAVELRDPWGEHHSAKPSGEGEVQINLVIKSNKCKRLATTGLHEAESLRPAAPALVSASAGHTSRRFC